MATKYQILVQERADLVREGELLAAEDGEWTKEQANRSSAITTRLMSIDSALLPLISEREARRHAPSSGGALDGITPSIGDGGLTEDQAAARGAPGGRRYVDLFGQPSPMTFESKGAFLTSVGLGLAHPAQQGRDRQERLRGDAPDVQADAADLRSLNEAHPQSAARCGQGGRAAAGAAAHHRQIVGHGSTRLRSLTMTLSKP